MTRNKNLEVYSSQKLRQQKITLSVFNRPIFLDLVQVGLVPKTFTRCPCCPAAKALKLQ